MMQKSTTFTAIFRLKKVLLSLRYAKKNQFSLSLLVFEICVS
jgi:hypothetical protein